MRNPAGIGLLTISPSPVNDFATTGGYGTVVIKIRLRFSERIVPGSSEGSPEQAMS